MRLRVRVRDGHQRLLVGLLLLAVAPCAARAQMPSPPAGPHGTVTGTVVDADGSLVSGANLTLTSGQFKSKDVSAADGTMIFADVPAGEFTIVVSAAGFAPVTVKGTLAAGESSELEPIALMIAVTSDSVSVTATQHDIASAEVHAQESQRVLGIVPNFYVSYDMNAKPLDASLKGQLTFRSSIDPVNLLLIGGTAAIEQATNTLNFGQNYEGYFQRFGVGMADFGIGNALGGYVFPVLFRQDPRYFVKGTGSFKSRLGYALSRAVIARGDNLKWQPAYASIAGELSSGALSNIYYPAANRDGVGLTFLNTLIGVGSNAINNVIEEFVLRHFSTGVPKSAPASPAAH